MPSDIQTLKFPRHLALLMMVIAITPTCKESPRRDAERPGRRTADAAAVAVGDDCPPVPLIQELHAASFYFQHGPAEQGQRHFKRATKLVGKTRDNELRDAISRLASISKRIDAEPDWAKTETELVRLFFSQWKCLTAPMHQGFHAKLPPIP